MTITKALASAAPSLFCLIPLLLLPHNARKSLNVWRALQVYDSQEATSSPPEPPVRSKKAKALAFLPSLAMLAFFFTSGVKEPHVVFVRSLFPYLFYFFIISLVSTMLIALACTTPSTTNVGRRYDAGQKSLIKSLTVSATNGSAAAIISAIASVIVFCVSSFIVPESIPYIVAAAGTAIWSTATWNAPTHKRYLTFHGMMLLPVLLIIFTAGLLLVVLAITFVVIFVVEKMSNPADANGGKKTLNMDKDLASEQALALYYPFVWASHVYFGAALALLAYRYDASQVNVAQVTKEDKQRILAELQPSTKTDGFGRQTIPLDKVAVPRFALSRKELPTFYTALFTIWTVQIVGVVVDFTTAWQPSMVFPLTEQAIPNVNMAVSVWPFLAYPFVLLAMLVCVSLHPHRSFKSLWTYGEEWETEMEQSHAEEKVQDSKA